MLTDFGLPTPRLCWPSQAICWDAAILQPHLCRGLEVGKQISAVFDPVLRGSLTFSSRIQMMAERWSSLWLLFWLQITKIYKQNSSLQDNLSLKWSCQLGTTVVRNIINLARTTATLCIKKNNLLCKMRQMCASRTWMGSQHHFRSQQFFYTEFMSFLANWHSKSSLISSRLLSFPCLLEK